MPDHEPYAVLLGSPDHVKGLIECPGDGFLDERVDAALHCHQCDLMMQARRHNDGHQVRLFPVQHLLYVGVTADESLGGCPRNSGLTDVGNGHQVDLGQVAVNPHVMTSHRAEPDDRRSQLTSGLVLASHESVPLHQCELQLIATGVTGPHRVVSAARRARRQCPGDLQLLAAMTCMANESRGIPNDDAMRRNIPGDDRPRPYQRECSNRQTREDDAAGTDRRPVVYPYLSDIPVVVPLELALRGDGPGHAVVGKHNMGPNEHAIFDRRAVIYRCTILDLDAVPDNNVSVDIRALADDTALSK
jgi:hypothetical protein